jgi:hypothetical protein
VSGMQKWGLCHMRPTYQKTNVRSKRSQVRTYLVRYKVTQGFVVSLADRVAPYYNAINAHVYLELRWPDMA